MLPDIFVGMIIAVLLHISYRHVIFRGKFYEIDG
jgi:hypothetical protein